MSDFDNLRSIFVARDGAIRAPWRIALFVLLSIVCFVLASVIVGPIFLWLFDLFGVIGVSNESWIEAVALLAATAICLHFIDKRPWSEVWLDREAARPSTLGAGFLIGAACIAIPILSMIAGGWLDKTPNASGSWLGAMSRVTLVLLPAALLEELLTRGYILSVLRHSWGWFWAIVATSIAFGLLHVLNDGATVESVVLVTLAGLFLAGVLYATKSLYAAWMAHFAWNWVMAAVFHTAVSGFSFEAPSYRYVDAGPDWATGGAWGPEGGIPAALGMAAGIALLVRLTRRRSKSPASPVSHVSQD